jgi:nanoRNase/pAp phosphatase (c-di-AMP/oligoRNAs hydrolase)
MSGNDERHDQGEKSMIAKDKMESLKDAVSRGTGPVLVLVHDYPDPDSLAGALGLCSLLESWDIESVIAHGRGMGRADNKAMAGLLDIDHESVKELPDLACRGAVLVDTQPFAGNNSLPGSITVLGVIDHHAPPETPCNDISHVDVRTEVGASSTMVLEYLDAADVELTTRLATALFLGIKTDTGDLLRGASRADVEAYVRLLPLVDLEAVHKITHGPLPDPYFDMLRSALEGAVRHDDALVAEVGAVPEPDLLSVVSELMLRTKGTALSLATGTYEDCVYLSLRVLPGRRNAGGILRDIMGPSGYGGGHELAAGGVIRTKDGNVGDASREAAKRFLAAVGREERPGQRLCREATAGSHSR